ncbi:MAG: 30S ribosomal protein S20 [Candidatus Pacebacteria bacterium]|nr:30S ribosomal protein S20 [Candidatus Paceibacterota bacterium]
MPITKAAKKSIRKDRGRKERNIQKKTEIKKLLKELAVFISEKKTEDAKKLLPQVYKALDKAAKTGLIKKNAVSRKKSRITKLISKTQK